MFVSVVAYSLILSYSPPFAPADCDAQVHGFHPCSKGDVAAALGVPIDAVVYTWEEGRAPPPPCCLAALDIQ